MNAGALARSPEVRDDVRTLARLIREGTEQVSRAEYAAADATLSRALRIDPTNGAAAFQYARCAARQRDWPELVRRWQAAAADQPSNIDAPIGLSDALRELGRLDEAERVLKDALVAFSCDRRLLPSLARLAIARRIWDRAVVCWQRYVESTPLDGNGHQGLGYALLQAGQYGAAERALRQSLALNPAELWTHVLLARARTLTGEWGAAFAAWLELKDQAADNRAVKTSFKEMMHALRNARADRCSIVDPLASAALPASPPDEEFRRWEELERDWFSGQDYRLMLRFESLGGSCEFGMVQRHYGAEPLGLLRWAAVPAVALIAALRTNLAGFGDAENTDLDLYEGREYAVIDTRYRLRSHTRVMADTVPRDVVFAQQCRRLRFLRDKMIEDLRDGEKILVYANRVRLADGEIDDLYSAVRLYGPNRLLCVRPEEPGCKSGLVQRRQEGLFVAYLDKPWPGGQAPVAQESWLEICRRTAELCDGADKA